MTEKRHQPNRLAKETSPYLRQHAHNPVDWYPWGKEALDRARREGKPIFLSIGYSACHWCHVMERESFEDEETAKLMNASFINIKVDREERPDLDHIYMTAVQAMTHHGGWPMSVFLTPDLKPFYGGTYFPPVDRMGMPSFRKILAGVANAWATRKEEVLQSAGQLLEALKQMDETTRAPGGEPLSVRHLDHALGELSGSFDGVHGGFGMAPKFFHTMDVRLALRHWNRTGSEASREMVTTTLDHWARGGIHDQLGGGFHRYSTDPVWLVPHFEKMLYDNALVAETYLEGYQATGNVEYAQVARDTLDYVLREMTSPEGGFYSTQDADSEGEEGKFYVWSREEIFRVLDKDLAEPFAAVFDVTEGGNWEGKNILRRKKPLAVQAEALGMDLPTLEETLAVAKRKLLEVRNRRVPPFRDEKVLVSWNGLMIDAFARGYQVLGDERYLAAARGAARFIWEKMARELKEKAYLLHSYKDGEARHQGYLDDYTHLISGLISLYEADWDPDWLDRAHKLAETILNDFRDERGGFYYTAHDHEALILRPRDSHDGATPSGASMAVTVLLRLGNLVGEPRYLIRAEEALNTQEPLIRQVPRAVGQMLLALDFHLSPPAQLYLVEGDDPEERDACLQLLRERFLPNRVAAFKARGADARRLAELIPPLAEKEARDGRTTLYLCERFTCAEPAVGTEAVERQLRARSPSHG